MKARVAVLVMFFGIALSDSFARTNVQTRSYDAIAVLPASPDRTPLSTGHLRTLPQVVRPQRPTSSLLSPGTRHTIAVLAANGPQAEPASSVRDQASIRSPLPTMSEGTVLNLYGQGPLTDAIMLDIAALPNLDYLNLDNTQLTDGLMIHLGNLKKLTFLGMDENPQVSGSGLAHLPADGKLEILAMRRTAVTDDSLAQLTKIATLRNLQLSNVGEVGLKHLAEMPNLQGLGLLTSDVSENGMKYLGTMRKIKSPSLLQCKFTDGALKNLSAVPSLETLSLRGSTITDAVIAGMDGPKSLRILNLSDTQIADAGLADVAKLTNLEELNLRRTQITDAGIPSLRSLKMLKRLNVCDTAVTEPTLMDLWNYLPDVEIANGGWEVYSKKGQPLSRRPSW